MRDTSLGDPVRLTVLKIQALTNPSAENIGLPGGFFKACVIQLVRIQRRVLRLLPGSTCPLHFYLPGPFSLSLPTPHPKSSLKLGVGWAERRGALAVGEAGSFEDSCNEIYQPHPPPLTPPPSSAPLS